MTALLKAFILPSAVTFLVSLYHAVAADRRRCGYKHTLDIEPALTQSIRTYDGTSATDNSSGVGKQFCLWVN